MFVGAFPPTRVYDEFFINQVSFLKSQDKWIDSQESQVLPCYVVFLEPKKAVTQKFTAPVSPKSEPITREESKVSCNSDEQVETKLLFVCGGSNY